MSAAQHDAGPRRGPAEPSITALSSSGAPQPASLLVDSMRLGEGPISNASGVRVLLNMVSTADGRASLGGLSGAISGPADRELFHALRGGVDAVLVGAGTVRDERYGRIIREPATRAARAARGMSPEPIACIVSASLSLDPALPLLAEPEARVAVLTCSQGSLEPCAAHVEYVREGSGGHLALASALRRVRELHGVRSVLCEGGPRLAGELLAAGLVDELFLTLAPVLAGGDPKDGRAPRIIAGAELEQPAQLELLGTLSSGSSLFLRYGVRAPARVSRATTDSSSLAR